jgi:CBS-domain-containing membrane protein
VFHVITANSSVGGTTVGVGVGVGVGIGVNADGVGVGVGVVLGKGALQPARTVSPPASNARRSRPGMIKL